MPKKVSQTTLKNKADRLVGQWFRDSKTCVASGWYKHQCSDRIEWAHIKSRSHGVIRHSPYNAVPLCNICHRKFTQNPDHWTRFIDEWFPGRWQMLDERLLEAYENREKPDYGYWIKWVQTRPKNDSWIKWFRRGEEVNNE